jgi:tRNA dimethylallyltransferase
VVTAVAEVPGAPPPLLAIVGPTGVGKTALAVALAGEWPIEAVSVDSRQVYRRLDIGTGKPGPAERRALPHHLIDVAEPEEAYDAARFAREAQEAIAAVRARGRWPVLVGGTGLYFRALVRGLAPRPPGDPELRRRLQGEAAALGPEGLHARLRDLDPAAAARLHPRDLVRVTRALEVVTLTGRPLGAPDAGGWRGEAGRHRLLTVGLTLVRPALDARLDARARAMVEAGLLDEVAGLLRAGVDPACPAMQGIGYRHLVPVARGRGALGDALRAMQRDTRRYARRQWTWFAREEGVTWVDAGTVAGGGLVAEVKRIVERAGLFDYPGVA